MRCSKIVKKLLPGTPTPEESIGYIVEEMLYLSPPMTAFWAFKVISIDGLYTSLWIRTTSTTSWTVNLTPSKKHTASKTNQSKTNNFSFHINSLQHCINVCFSILHNRSHVPCLHNCCQTISSNNMLDTRIRTKGCR